MSNITILVYSRVGDLEIRLDIDFPSRKKSTDSIIPALIFFHGGGLVGGNRQSFIPMQLKQSLVYTTRNVSQLKGNSQRFPKIDISSSNRLFRFQGYKRTKRS
jgi:hypothetical protein